MMPVLSSAGRAVDRFASPATLRRWNASGWQANGVFSETSGVATSQIMAVVQAPSERDMRLLPEGERIEAYVTIWTRAALRTSDEAAGTRADEVIGEGGQRYRVVRIASRVEGGFTRAIGRMVHDDAERGL
jgi:hypothetical protein